MLCLEYTPPDQTTTKKLTLRFRTMRGSVRRTRPHFCMRDDWLLHQENAYSHFSDFLQHFCRTSHRSASSAFIQGKYNTLWLTTGTKFENLIERWGVRQWKTSQETRAVKAISKSVYQECFNKWKHNPQKALTIKRPLKNGSKSSLQCKV